MPTYEYECLDCKFRFDVFQKMNDEPVKECTKCKGRVKRLIGSGAGIIFKGSGFYVTDYKKGSAAKDSPGNGSVKKEDSPSGEKKSSTGSSEGSSSTDTGK